MAQSFTHGDATNLKFRSNAILAKLFALPEFPTENLVPEALDDGRGQGLTPYGIRFSGGAFLDRCARIRGVHIRRFTKKSIAHTQAGQKWGEKLPDYTNIACGPKLTRRNCRSSPGGRLCAPR